MIKAVFRTAKEAWTDRNQRRIFITFELQTLEDRGLLALGQTYFLHDNESLKMFSTEDIARGVVKSGVRRSSDDSPRD